MHGAKSGGNQEEVFQSPLPVESHRMSLILPTITPGNTCRGYQGSSLVSLSKVFSGGRSCRSSLPFTWQNPRLPEGKQVFSMNMVFAQSRHSEPSLSLGNGGKTPESQVPRCWTRANIVSRPF